MNALAQWPKIVIYTSNFNRGQAYPVSQKDSWPDIGLKALAIIHPRRGLIAVGLALIAFAGLLVSPSLIQLAVYVLGESGVLTKQTTVPVWGTEPWLTCTAVGLVLLGAAIGVVGHLLDRRPLRSTSILAVRHQSLEGNTHPIEAGELPKDLKGAELSHKWIDQTSFYSNGRLTEPGAALRLQADLAATVRAFIGAHPGSPIIYYGKAHIPFVFAAGHALQGDVRVLPYELERSTGSWRLLEEGSGDDLGVVVDRNGRLEGQTDAIVMVSVSYGISLADVAQILPANLPTVHIRLSSPKIDCIRTRGQVDAIAQAFRKALDELRTASRIHVFCAAPISVVFALGQRVSPTIHPSLQIHNHSGSDTIKYGWAIRLNGGAAPEAIQVNDIASVQGDAHV